MNLYTPQPYPLFAMIVGEDRFDINPEFGPTKPIAPADICIVIGWDSSDGDVVEHMVPVLAQLDYFMGAGEYSPIWPTANCFYELRLAMPTEADRTHFAQRAAAAFKARLARRQAKLARRD